MATERKPKRITKPKRGITVMLDHELHAAVQQQAEDGDFEISLAAWIRAAIREKLSRDGKAAA